MGLRLLSAGVSNPNDVNAQIRRDFPSGRAADVVSKIVSQKESFANDAKLYNEAQGLNAIGNNQFDPFVALNSLQTSLSNFAGTLTSPAMQSAAGVLSSMASSLGSWARNWRIFSKIIRSWRKALRAARFAAGTIGGGSRIDVAASRRTSP